LAQEVSVNASASQHAPDRSAVEACLDQIVDPCSTASVTPMSIVEMGLLRGVDISASGKVDVHLRISNPGCMMVSYMTGEAIRLISALGGVTEVSVDCDDGMDWDPDMIDPKVQERRRQRLALLPLAIRE
jgi:metal-sulfur cluster biosynthetic enzyme